ncbi:MAG: hypothetical protein GY699_24290 [Desulfobacteraceae bacterium]|nr:hypothetical protein [Desulfobacteraceae bacterium]
MKLNFKHITIAFFTLFLIFGCSRSYSIFFFSYPADSQPHENNWTHLGKIIAWDPRGKKATEQGKRKIEIIIHDKKESKLLHDEIELVSSMLDKKIIWNEFENLQIMLYESGNEFVEDEYNKKLVKEGPRHLITLNYYWNGSKFIKK